MKRMSLLGSAGSKTKRNCRAHPATAPESSGLRRESARNRAAETFRRRSRTLSGTGLWRGALATNARLADRAQDRKPHSKGNAANPASPRPLPDLLARPHPRPCRRERNGRTGQTARLRSASRLRQRSPARLHPRTRRNAEIARRTESKPAGPGLVAPGLAVRTLARTSGGAAVAPASRMEQHP